MTPLRTRLTGLVVAFRGHRWGSATRRLIPSSVTRCPAVRRWLGTPRPRRGATTTVSASGFCSIPGPRPGPVFGVPDKPSSDRVHHDVRDCGVKGGLALESSIVKTRLPNWPMVADAPGNTSAPALPNVHESNHADLLRPQQEMKVVRHEAGGKKLNATGTGLFEHARPNGLGHDRRERPDLWVSPDHNVKCSVGVRVSLGWEADPLRALRHRRDSTANFVVVALRGHRSGCGTRRLAPCSAARCSAAQRWLVILRPQRGATTTIAPCSAEQRLPGSRRPQSGATTTLVSA